MFVHHDVEIQSLVQLGDEQSVKYYHVSAVSM